MILIKTFVKLIIKFHFIQIKVIPQYKLFRQNSKHCHNNRQKIKVEKISRKNQLKHFRIKTTNDWSFNSTNKFKI